MSRVKDYLTDENPVPFFVAEAAREMPDYVKEASFPTTEEVAAVASGMFADPHSRLLPCHTKVATLLSGIYFHGSEEWKEVPTIVRDVVAERLEKAAQVHGVSDDLEFYRDVFNHLEKEASTEDEVSFDDKYALWVADGGTTSAYYPMGDEYSVVKSARAVVEDSHFGRIPADWYVTACQELVKAAADLGVPDNELPDQLLAAGRPRLPDFDHARFVAGFRKQAGVPDEGVAVYREIVDAAEAEYDETGSLEGIEKWAGLWMDLDATNGVKYSRGVSDPFQAFFSGNAVADMEKAAAELVLVCDVLVPRKVFAGIDPGFVKAAFSKEAGGVIAEAVRLAGAGDAPAAGQVLIDLDAEDSVELLRKLASM